MAKWCFQLGMVCLFCCYCLTLCLLVTVLLTYLRSQNLKRVEVIEDDEEEIMEAARRMSERYDFVVTRYVLATCVQPFPAGCATQS